MHWTTLYLAALGTVAAADATGKLGDAAVITNNPAGAVYVATFPDRDDTTVRGSITASSSNSGKGVDFKVSVSGLPLNEGQFTYHIHDQPVPEDGNCTKTLAHLDPYERGEDPVCDASQPQTCQVGDNSGKHGKLSAPSTSQTYTDDYAALVPGIGAFFGNRSVVIHFTNKTRITCANFVKFDGSSSSSGAWSTPTLNSNSSTLILSTPSTPTATPSSTPASSATDRPSSGSARGFCFSGAVLAAAFVAAML